METFVIQRIVRNALLSLFIYAIPVVGIYLTVVLSGEKPWLFPPVIHSFGEGDFHSIRGLAILTLNNFRTWGLPIILLLWGLIEFAVGLYDEVWTKNERILDFACFTIPKILLAPVFNFYSLKVLPVLLPNLANSFSWIPFWWGVLFIAIADDLTHYWYHRLHHEIPFLWRFHRTHHSAPYMGMAMASRQGIWFSLFFAPAYLTAALTYLGLGFPAIFVLGIKGLITLFAHSSIKWDKLFYENKFLQPIGWVLERTISTPATHHAHHAATHGDGVGFYKGNFGNMFFLWDVIFGTGIITRQYPESYGLHYYQGEEWYVQLFWPFFKSKIKGSELSADGPEVFDETPVGPVLQPLPLTPLVETA